MLTPLSGLYHLTTAWTGGPEGASNLWAVSVRRADRPHCGQRASPRAPPRRGARAYAGALPSDHRKHDFTSHSKRSLLGQERDFRHATASYKIELQDIAIHLPS